jgi:hypothetical protein
MTRHASVKVLSVETIEQLPQSIRPRSEYFTLLLAWDAPTVHESQLQEWMRPLVDRGLVYFCAWGERCEAVHDAVDRCDIGKDGAKSDFVIMTTWHNTDSLEKACWFFKELALPNETSGIAKFDRFAVAVGNRQWAERMKRYFSA